MVVFLTSCNVLYICGYIMFIQSEFIQWIYLPCMCLHNLLLS